MIIECRCDKCENRVFDVDTQNLDYPFSSEMFPQTVDCLHSRTWQFPNGPVNMELTCPACGGFPFEFRDGRPSGRLKVKDSSDGRFLKLVHWRELASVIPQVGPIYEVVESIPTTNLKPKGKKNARHQTVR